MRSMIFATIFMAAALSAQAGQRFVNPDGSGLYPTIQAAVNDALTGDTIFLLDGTFTGPGNRDVEIDIDVTIKSNDIFNPVVIDCQGSAGDPHRAFIIYDGTPTLDHLIIRGGYATSGGAVTADGGLPLLSYCQFEDNTATQHGGALAADGAESVIADHCIFATNTAGVDGGAVFAGGNFQIMLSNCTLFRNQAPVGSGVFTNTNAECLITSSIIAFGRGGSALSDYYGGGWGIDCTDMFGNQGGDWIGWFAGQLPLNGNISVDPIFCDPMGRPANYALMPDSPVGNPYVCGALGAKLPDPAWPAPVYGVTADGTGMYPTIQATIDVVPNVAVIALENGTYTGSGNRDLELLEKNIHLKGRSGDPLDVVIDAGGSIYDYHQILTANGDPGLVTRLSGLTFTGSRALDRGAILVPDLADVAIENCHFESNLMDQPLPGSDIDATAAQRVVITGCTFSKPYENVSVGLHGVAGEISIAGSTFIGGGGILITDSVGPGPVSVDGCHITCQEGVGLEIVGTTAPVAVQNCYFIDQMSTYSVKVQDSPNVAFTGCTMAPESHSLLFYPVGIFNSTASFTSCDFIGASGGNPALAVKGTDANLSFTMCDFSNFIHASINGLVYSTGGSLGFDGCDFHNNSTGINHTGPGSLGLTVSNTVFDGQQILCLQAEDTTAPIILADNQFSNSGQGVELTLVDNCSIHDCTFNAIQGQSALTLNSSGGNINNCTFTNNASDDSGGAMSLYNVDVYVMDCTFADNTAVNNGGAVELDTGSVNFIRCSFDRNHGQVGGGFYGSGASVNLNLCDFNANVAWSNGGGIYTGNCGTYVITCNLIDNVATFDGGGATHRYSGNTTYISGLVKGNQGGTGGGISTLGATITFNELEITENTAGQGGAAHFMNSETTFNDCSITGNSAFDSGGVEFDQQSGWSSSALVSGTVIAGNEASNSRGSGVSAEDGVPVTVQRSTIVGNGGAGAAGQVFCDEGSTVVLDSSIIAFGTHGPAAALGNSVNTVTAQNCDVFGNAGGDWVEALAGQNGTACNFSLHPLFCDAAGGDYHLAEMSPCLAVNNPCTVDVGALGLGCPSASPTPELDLPVSFAVLGNAPNPFNPQTVISFELPAAGPVVLDIYDVTGHRVRSLVRGEQFAAGHHRVTWNGADDAGRIQSSGVYLYRVQAEGKILGGRMTMLR